MPDPLEGIHPAASRALMPTDLLGATTVADPLWTELKGSAGFTALHQESMALRTLPEGSIKPVGHRRGQGHAGREVGGSGDVRFFGHIVLRTHSDART